MPISDDQRQRIIDLHGQGLSRNDIARQTGVSAGSVTNVCKQNDLSFDRSGTEKATKSKQADDKAMRALIASDALNVVQSVSKILAHRLATNPDDIPTRDLVTMYGVLTDKHLAIVKTDIDTGAEEGVSMVTAMMDGLRTLHQTSKEAPEA